MSLDTNPFGPPHRVVAPGDWHSTIRTLRDQGYTYFDWLSAVDEHPEGFRLVIHLARLKPLDHLLIATYIDRDAAALESVTDVFAGAAWHERETHEMFGIGFTSMGTENAPLEPLLLPDSFEGNPLRKEFVLASRVAKQWPGAKEPGESGGESPSRRRMKPPGVPEDWADEHAPEPVGPDVSAQGSANLGPKRRAQREGEGPHG